MAAKDIIIGDVHGCYDALITLLHECDYQPEDRLWFVGDLINRGRQSLDVVKFVSDLGDKAKVVLGNHDMHFIGVCLGARKLGARDNFGELLSDQYAAEYASWLMQLPFAIYDEALDMLMVHAGIYPEWDTKTTLAQANSLSSLIQASTNPKKLFIELFDNRPKYWQQDLPEIKRNRASLNILTRMRYMYYNDEKQAWRLDFDYKGELDGTQEYAQASGKELIPWFMHPGFIDSAFMTSGVENNPSLPNIVFGHWSALGLYQKNKICCLDGGYLWGGSLHAKVIYNQDYNNSKIVSLKR